MRVWARTSSGQGCQKCGKEKVSAFHRRRRCRLPRILVRRTHLRTP
ncbi:hypothetical protein [Sinomonas sp. G460-2]